MGAREMSINRHGLYKNVYHKLNKSGTLKYAEALAITPIFIGRLLNFNLMYARSSEGVHRTEVVRVEYVVAKPSN